MTVRELVDLVLYIAAVLTAIGAIIIFLQKFLITPMKNALKEEVTDLVKEIHDQVTPNGGGSLKDDVTLTRQETTETRRMLETHMMEEVPRAWRALDQLQERFDQLQARFDQHVLSDHHREQDV